jgi:hypothetical protein
MRKAVRAIRTRSSANASARPNTMWAATEIEVKASETRSECQKASSSSTRP